MRTFGDAQLAGGLFGALGACYCGGGRLLGLLLLPSEAEGTDKTQ